MDGLVDLMRLVNRWQRAGLEVSFAEMAASPTLASWDERLSRAWAAESAQAPQG